MKTVYISDDGIEFSTKEECIEYENRTKTILKSLIFRDESGKLIPTEDVLYGDLGACDYAMIRVDSGMDESKSNEFLADVRHFVYHQSGIDIHGIKEPNVPYVYFDEIDKYLPLPQFIENLEKDLRNATKVMDMYKMDLES